MPRSMFTKFGVDIAQVVFHLERGQRHAQSQMPLISDSRTSATAGVGN